MKFYILNLLILLYINEVCIAQKQVLKNDSYKSWEKIYNYGISANGKYCWYEIGKLEEGADRIIVVSLVNGKKTIYDNAHDVHFSPDGEYIAFLSPQGLSIIQLKRMELQMIDSVSTFDVPSDGNGQWITYNKGNAFVLRNLRNGKERKYLDVNTSKWNNSGTFLALQIKNTIIGIDLNKNTEKVISTCGGQSNLTFDQVGNRMAFSCKNGDEVSMYYFESGLDSAKCILGKGSHVKDSIVVTDDLVALSPDGRFLYFKIAQRVIPHVKNDDIKVPQLDVWSYKDEYIQSEQGRLGRPGDRHYTATIAIGGEHVLQLENERNGLYSSISNKYVILRSVTNDYEAYWNKSEIPKYTLIDISSGKQTDFVPTGHILSRYVSLSPSQKFVYWFDDASKGSFCYEISTGKIESLTKGIDVPVAFRSNDEMEIIQWMAEDKLALVNRYGALWMVDPTGSTIPIDITSGYSYAKHINLRVVISSDDIAKLHQGDSILLAGLSDSNCYNGFLKTKLQKGATPKLYNLEPCMYYFPGAFLPEPDRPMKAIRATVYLLQRQSSLDAPNLFLTKDFIHFKQISDIHPQVGFNWLTTERIHWKMDNGEDGTGILYKPEDFDSTKKYPIIFHYYEKRSDECYQYLYPTLSNGGLSIPWYVSNGYLVFVPDIIRQKGIPGERARLSVVSAANFLTEKYSWIDKGKMGLQGHSYGGYETNYIVTHSTIFAAAQSSAGPADLISHYGSLGFGGKSLAFMFETGQIILGTTPWAGRDIFINNSPIFFVDRVATPLLLMHNKNDGVVPFAQSLELFTALRRLQKPVWLLQYDGEDHILGGPFPALDFTIRQQQFFDHYLRNGFLPPWLASGIPFFEKGINSGL